MSRSPKKPVAERPPESSATTPPARGPRDRGMVYFVVKYGLLAWGLGAGVVYFLMEWARKAPDLGQQAIFSLTAFPAIGLLAGLLMWFLGGRKKNRP